MKYALIWALDILLLLCSIALFIAGWYQGMGEQSHPPYFTGDNNLSLPSTNIFIWLREGVHNVPESLNVLKGYNNVGIMFSGY